MLLSRLRPPASVVADAPGLYVAFVAKNDFNQAAHLLRTPGLFAALQPHSPELWQRHTTLLALHVLNPKTMSQCHAQLQAALDIIPGPAEWTAVTVAGALVVFADDNCGITGDLVDNVSRLAVNVFELDHFDLGLLTYRSAL